MQTGTRTLPSIAVPGILAGLVGGLSIDIYVIVTSALVSHDASPGGLAAFLATATIGPGVFLAGAPPAYLGVAVHLVVSAVWGIAYVWLATTQPQLRSRPIVSGLAYGLLVMLGTQTVEVAMNAFRLPDAYGEMNTLVSYLVFFGLPLALTATRALRTR